MGSLFLRSLVGKGVGTCSPRDETGCPDDGVDGVAAGKRLRDILRCHSLANENKKASTLVARPKRLFLHWQDETIAGELQCYLSWASSLSEKQASRVEKV